MYKLSHLPLIMNHEVNGIVSVSQDLDKLHIFTLL